MLQRQEQHFTTTKDDYNMLVMYFSVSSSEEKVGAIVQVYQAIFT